MRFNSLSGAFPRFAQILPAALLLVFLGSTSLSAHAQKVPAGLSASAVREIKEIYAFKATYTEAEKKMSSNLVLASRAAAGKSLGKMSRFLAALPTDADGNVLVDVDGVASPALIRSAAVSSFEKVSGVDTPATYQHAHLRAHVRAGKLAALAAESDVSSIREAVGAHTNVGSVTSQGYVAMGANKVVATGVNGTGVKVGVLSDSATPARVAALIASGDLPSDVVVLPGQAGPSPGDEGSAMMEIIHDVAPGAKLFFATAFTSEQSFADNIRTLRFTYGCDIIVDDISYFDEPVFQDGMVAKAVNDVTADGALYFSSAANSGNLTSGTSGTWEGDFTPGGTNAVITTFEGAPVQLNNFGTVGSPQTYDTLTSVANSGVYLHWSDPLGGSSNDYDLFILNSTGTTVKAFGATAQTGTQDPFEFVQPSSTYTPAAGDRVVVALYAGAARALHVDTERATLSIGTSGATFGHNAGASTFSAAAVYWNAAHTGAKPFVGGASNPDEVFSSDGPRKIFYNPDGTPITPGNFLFATSGGKTLIKPDGAGADGTSAATPGFSPFFGTSAAAPHLAGVAALIKSAVPSITNLQIRQAMTSTALDNMEPGIDRDSGYGIVSAPAAIAAAKALLK